MQGPPDGPTVRHHLPTSTKPVDNSWGGQSGGWTILGGGQTVGGENNHESKFLCIILSRAFAWLYKGCNMRFTTCFMCTYVICNCRNSLTIFYDWYRYWGNMYTAISGWLSFYIHPDIGRSSIFTAKVDIPIFFLRFRTTLTIDIGISILAISVARHCCPPLPCCSSDTAVLINWLGHGLPRHFN